MSSERMMARLKLFNATKGPDFVNPDNGSGYLFTHQPYLDSDGCDRGGCGASDSGNRDLFNEVPVFDEEPAFDAVPIFDEEPAFDAVPIFDEELVLDPTLAAATTLGFNIETSRYDDLGCCGGRSYDDHGCYTCSREVVALPVFDERVVWDEVLPHGLDSHDDLLRQLAQGSEFMSSQENVRESYLPPCSSRGLNSGDDNQTLLSKGPAMCSAHHVLDKMPSPSVMWDNDVSQDYSLRHGLLVDLAQAGQYVVDEGKYRKVNFSMRNWDPGILSYAAANTYEISSSVLFVKNSIMLLVQIHSSNADLKVELEAVKQEHNQLKEKDAETESIVADLHVKLQKCNSELEAAVAAESKATSASDDLMLALQQLSSESKNALQEEDMTEKNFRSELDEILYDDTQNPKVIFLDKHDVLLAEHKIEKALLTQEAEEKKYLTADEPGKESNTENTEISAFKAALFKRKSILEDQLVRCFEQPSFSVTQLRRSLSGLIKIGKSSLAHQVLLKVYDGRLQISVKAFLHTCSIYTETYSATLSQLVFSAISKASHETTTLFGDSPMNTNRIIQWAEYEMETFARLVKENSPLPESISALRSACTCIQTSLTYCSYLESHGLKFSKLLMVLLCPYIEEVLEMNFRRVRRKIVDSLIKVLPGPSEDDNLVESKEPAEFKAESDVQQLTLIGTAYTVADELLPSTLSMFFGMQTEKKGTSGFHICLVSVQQWKRGGFSLGEGDERPERYIQQGTVRIWDPGIQRYGLHEVSHDRLIAHLQKTKLIHQRRGQTEMVEIVQMNGVAWGQATFWRGGNVMHSPLALCHHSPAHDDSRFSRYMWIGEATGMASKKLRRQNRFGSIPFLRRCLPHGGAILLAECSTAALRCAHVLVVAHRRLRAITELKDTPGL